MIVRISSLFYECIFAERTLKSVVRYGCTRIDIDVARNKKKVTTTRQRPEVYSFLSFLFTLLVDSGLQFPVFSIGGHPLTVTTENRSRIPKDLKHWRRAIIFKWHFAPRSDCRDIMWAVRRHYLVRIFSF